MHKIRSFHGAFVDAEGAGVRANHSTQKRDEPNFHLVPSTKFSHKFLGIQTKLSDFRKCVLIKISGKSP